jgi:hypothetical protein
VKNVPRLSLALASIIALASDAFAQTPPAQSQTTAAAQSRAAAVAHEGQSPGGTDETAALLERVRARVREYHARLFSVAFTETVTQQAFDDKLRPKGRAREFVFESVVARRAPREGRERELPLVTRKLTRLDGRAAGERERERRDAALAKPSCAGPNEPAASYSDPLLFLLPENAADFVFRAAGEEEFEGRTVFVLAAESRPADEPVRLKIEDNCIRLSRGLRRRVRVLVDPASFDVLQLRWELAETFTGRTGTTVVRKGIFFRPAPSRELSYERQETTITFRPVAFRDPAETLLLPVSYDFFRVMRGARDPGFRLTQTYSNYRRFLTSVEVKDVDDDPR